MGIWDKSKLLDGARMDEAYEPGTPFILYGMKVAGELELDKGYDGPATKTVMLTEEVASDGNGDWTPLTEREVTVVGTLSGPIAQMASAAGDEDFPVVVSWKEVPTKTRERAVVLDYHGEWTGDGPPSTPPEWHRY